VTKYEELCELATANRENWLNAQNICRQGMIKLVQGFGTYCMVPANKAEYFEWNEETGDYDGSAIKNVPIAAMKFDDDGYAHLGVAIKLTNSPGRSGNWVTFALVVSQEDGKLTAKLSEKGKPYPIDFNNVSVCNEFYEVIVQEIKQSLASPRSRSAIGFKFAEPELTTVAS